MTCTTTLLLMLVYSVACCGLVAGDGAGVAVNGADAGADTCNPEPRTPDFVGFRVAQLEAAVKRLEAANAELATANAELSADLRAAIAGVHARLNSAETTMTTTTAKLTQLRFDFTHNRGRASGGAGWIAASEIRWPDETDPSPAPQSQEPLAQRP